jgi:hypothetical protein
VAAALVGGGAAAAVVVGQLPSGLIGFIGVVPLLRGVGRLTSVRFREDDAFERGAAIADVAAAYLPLAGTRAGAEVLVASGAVVVAAAVAALRPWRLRSGFAGWTLVGVGVFLFVDGGAFAWLLPR